VEACAGTFQVASTRGDSYVQSRTRHSMMMMMIFKSNVFAVNKMHNITVYKITFHLAGQTGDSFALTSAHNIDLHKVAENLC